MSSCNLEKPGSRAASLIASARDLIPVIDRAGERIERERRLPEEVLDGLYDARLFRLTIPRSCDGEEVEPATLFQVVEALAQGDGSVAWCVGQANGVATASAYLSPLVRDAIFADRKAVVASGPNNVKAQAVICDGGCRVTGHWRFASGSAHATWLGGHCTICERDGTPRVDQTGKLLDQLTVMFPKASAEMTDVWNVMGLKGTASNDYAVSELFVAADHTYTRESDTIGARKARSTGFPFSTCSGFLFRVSRSASLGACWTTSSPWPRRRSPTQQQLPCATTG